MAKDIPKVVALNSKSDDEIEIVSENISNYGSNSTPVEVSLELQEKIRMSLEKGGNLPGKIKAIKVYAIRGSSHNMGSVQTVRARLQSSNGQPSQTINVGSSINALFSNAVFPSPVQGIRNNSSKLNKADRASAKPYQAQNSSEPPLKSSQQQLEDDAYKNVPERPPISSSPVTILYSPIRKRKPPQKKTIAKLFEGENSSQRKSKVLKREENQVNTSDILFKNLDNNSESFNSIVNSVKLSPMEFSGDETDDDLFAEDSILAFCNSPVPSPPGAGDSNGDKESSHKINTLEKTDKESPYNTLENMDQSEDIMSEIHEKFKECEIIAKQCEYDGDTLFESERRNIKKKVNMDEEFDKLFEPKRQNSSKKVNRDEEFDKLFEPKIQKTSKKVNKDESKEKNMDEEFDKLFEPKGQNSSKKVNKDESKKVNRDEEFDKLFESKRQNSSIKETSKYVMINVVTPLKRFFGSSEENRETQEKQLFQNMSVHQEEKAPPLWTTIFPPSPLSPPPPNWTNSSNMFDLNVGEFLAVTGLCKPETARHIRGKLNAPKPLVRVLRKKKP